MKKNLLNQNLMKSLLNSNYLLVEETSELNSRFINSHYIVNKKQNIICLNIFELIKDLKQVIRILSFIKKQTLLKKNLNFFVDDKNNSLKFLINEYCQANNSQHNFFFDINSHNLNTSQIKEKAIHLGIIINNVILNNKTFIKNQFNRNIFLFLNFNSVMNQNFVGYKVYNNINDYKKILFLLSFLRQIL